MIWYFCFVNVLKVNITGNNDDLNTRVSGGSTPVIMTEGSSGRGRGGSIVIISFFGSAKNCFTRSVFLGMASLEILMSNEILDKTAMSSACRKRTFLVSGPPGSFTSSVMKSYSTFANSFRYAAAWSSLLSSHSTIKYQWK